MFKDLGISMSNAFKVILLQAIHLAVGSGNYRGHSPLLIRKERHLSEEAPVLKLTDDFSRTCEHFHDPALNEVH
jgi:hypothetical protein